MSKSKTRLGRMDESGIASGLSTSATPIVQNSASLGQTAPRSSSANGSRMQGIVIALFLAMIFSSVNAYHLNCTTKLSCDIGETDVLHMSELTNAHAEFANQSNYAYKICCKDTDAVMGVVEGSGNPFLHLSDLTNAQVEQSNQLNYIYNATMSVNDSGYEIGCYYKANSCTGSDSCVASISDSTNAQIGQCGSYQKNVCCRIQAKGGTTGCSVLNSSGSYSLSADVVGAPNNASSLTGNACMKIAASNVIFDCNGYSITNNGTAGTTYGILLNGSLTNVTVKNCPDISGYNFGVYVFNSTSSVVQDIYAHDNNYGFYLISSDDNLLANNNAEDNLRGIYIISGSNNNLTSNSASYNTNHGFFIQSEANHTTLTNNTAFFNNDGFFIISALNTLTDNQAYNNVDYGFFMNTSSNNTLLNNSAHDNDYGFYLISSSDNVLEGNNAEDNLRGIYIISGTGNNLANNTASYNTNNGFLVQTGANFTTLFNNTAFFNSDGFRIASSNNNLTSNTAYSNTYNGFNLTSSSNNTLLNNSAHDNDYGFYLISSDDNLLANNNAEDNVRGIYIISGSNNNLTSNSASYNTNHGFFIQENSDNNTLTSNSAFRNGLSGVYVKASNNTRIQSDHYYANGADFLVNATTSDIFINLTSVIFDSPPGNLQNFTNLSISDSVSASSSYIVNWTRNTSAFVSYRSFNKKFVKIQTKSGAVSIDNAVWQWKASETAGYNEALFFLAKYSGSWGKVATAVLDTGAHTLSVENMNPASDYGIFENGTALENCPEITTSGTVTLTQNQAGAKNIPTPFTNFSCVNIKANDVTLDCNNFSITGGIHDSDNMTFGIFVGCGVNHTTIKNCPGISNYTYGIYVCKSNYTNISNVDISNNSIDGIFINSSNHVTLNKVNSHDNGNNGITIDPSSDGIYTQYSGYNNGGSGIEIQGGSDNQFSSVTLHDNNNGAEVLDSQAFVINGGNIHDNAQAGILVVNSYFTGSGFTVSNNGLIGVSLSDGSSAQMDSLQFSGNNNQDFLVDGLSDPVSYNLTGIFYSAASTKINVSLSHTNSNEKYATFGNVPDEMPAGASMFPRDGAVLNWTIMSGSPVVNNFKILFTTSQIGGYELRNVHILKNNGTRVLGEIVWFATNFTRIETGWTLDNLDSFSQYGPFSNSSAFVQGIAAANVTAGNQTRWSGMNASNVTTEGGNVTDLGINMTAVTDRWAAFYGNVTGSLALKEFDLPAYAVYEWSWNASDNGGFVCVAENPTYNFITIEGATPNEIDTAWGFDSYSDNAINTFSNGSCTVDLSLSTATATQRAKTGNGATNDPFYTCPLKSPTSTSISPGDQLKFAFCAPIMGPSGYNWKSENINFEMIVPTAAGPGTETYYFFAQLN